MDWRVNTRRDCRYYIARRTNTALRNKFKPLGFGGGKGEWRGRVCESKWVGGGERGNGVDWRVNTRRDCRYYIARRTNTTFRIKSRPLGFGWGGGKGEWRGWVCESKCKTGLYILHC